MSFCIFALFILSFLYCCNSALPYLYCILYRFDRIKCDHRTRTWSLITDQHDARNIVYFSEHQSMFRWSRYTTSIIIISFGAQSNNRHFLMFRRIVWCLIPLQQLSVHSCTFSIRVLLYWHLPVVVSKSMKASVLCLA